MKKLLALLLLSPLMANAYVPDCPFGGPDFLDEKCYAHYNYANGDKYKGYFEDEYKRNGRGNMFYANGDTFYGYWKDNEKHGQGKMTYANGDTYVGEWKDNKKHGQGTMTYANGKKEVGEFKDGEYVVEFKDDKPVEKSLREQLNEARMKLLTGPTKNIELFDACTKDFQRYMQPFLEVRNIRLKSGDPNAMKDYNEYLGYGNELYLSCFRDGLRF